MLVQCDQAVLKYFGENATLSSKIVYGGLSWISKGYFLNKQVIKLAVAHLVCDNGTFYKQYLYSLTKQFSNILEKMQPFPQNSLPGTFGALHHIYYCLW